MRTSLKAGTATAAGIIALATWAMPGTAFAGTGGPDGAGVSAGEGDHYCDYGAASVQVVDSTTMAPLPGSQVVVTPDPGTFLLAGYDPAVVDAFRAAFTTAIDQAWADSPDGQVYLAAQETGDESVTFPVDITAQSNPTNQQAALAGWSEHASTVAYSAYVDDLIGRIGVVLYGDSFDPANPLAANTPASTMIADSAAYADANGKYVAALEGRATLDAAIAAADSGDWDAFVAAYATLTDPANIVWGLEPATLDYIFRVLGPDAVAVANAAAAASVGASSEPITLTTDGDGAPYTMLGYSTVRDDASCANLGATVVQTVSVDGHILDDTPYHMVPSNVAGTVAELTIPNPLPNDPAPTTPPGTTPVNGGSGGGGLNSGSGGGATSINTGLGADGPSTTLWIVGSGALLAVAGGAFALARRRDSDDDVQSPSAGAVL